MEVERKKKIGGYFVCKLKGGVLTEKVKKFYERGVLLFFLRTNKSCPFLVKKCVVGKKNRGKKSSETKTESSLPTTKSSKMEGGLKEVDQKDLKECLGLLYDRIDVVETTFITRFFFFFFFFFFLFLFFLFFFFFLILFLFSFFLFFFSFFFFPFSFSFSLLPILFPIASWKKPFLAVK